MKKAATVIQDETLVHAKAGTELELGGFRY